MTRPLVGLIGVLAALAGPVDTLAQEDEDSEETPVISWVSDEGLWIRPRFGNLRVRVGGRAQLDLAGFAGGDDPVDLGNGAAWRRVRLAARGSFLRRWSFGFEWDLVGDDPPNLKDAWTQVAFTPFDGTVALRAGRFTSTFGLENDGSSNDTLFMEQGLTSVFVPPQLTGVLVHSESDRRRWDLSFSSGAGELTKCLVCDVVGVAGRYSTSVDFGSGAPLLHVGGNYSRRWPDQTIRYAQRPESFVAAAFVDTGLLRANRVDTALLEMALLSGPASLQSEFAVARLSQSDSSPPVFRAFYLSGSYSLTGEPRTYNAARGTVRRIRPSQPVGDGYGAFEVATRWSHIDLDDQGVTGGTLNDVSVGLNWYPTNPTRVMFNVIRAKRNTWDAVWIFQSRLQIAY
jgi:phosphate-selective porin OprO/OprP